MAMTTREAFYLLEMISDAYMTDFKEKQIDLWISMLTEDGNYEKSKAKLTEHINTNKFPPRIADFKVKENYNPADDYKRKIERDKQIVQQEMNDPEKRKRREQNLKRMQQMMERLKAGDNDE